MSTPARPADAALDAALLLACAYDLQAAIAAQDAYATRQAVLCVLELADAVAEDSQAFQVPPGYPPPPPLDPGE